MREQLEQFVERACRAYPETADILRIEILSGCAHCGRRLLEAGDMVRPGTVSLDVRDERTDELFAKYAVCSACIGAATTKP